MSFMAGFGSSFSKSFENASDRRAQREDDMFRMKYQDFIRLREKRDEQEKEASSRMKQAQAIYADYGDVLPQNSVNWINERLEAGYTREEIKGLLDNGSLVPRTPSTPAMSLDQQMADSGLGGGVEAASAPTSAPDMRDTSERQASAASAVSGTEQGGGAVSDFMSSLGFERQTGEDRVNERLDDVTGGNYSKFMADGAKLQRDMPSVDVTYVPKQRNRFMDGLTESNLPIRMAQAAESGTAAEYLELERVQNSFVQFEQAKANASEPHVPWLMSITNEDGSTETRTVRYNGFTVQNMDGSEVPMSSLGNVTPLSSVEQANGDTLELIKMGKDELTSLTSRANGLASLANGIDQVERILDGNQAANTPIARWTSVFKDGAFNIDTAINELRTLDGKMIQEVNELGLDSIKESDLTGTLDNMTGINEGARYLQALKIKMVFAQLSLSGQEGRAVSVQEFEATMSNMFDGSRGEQLVPHLKNLMRNEMSNYEAERKGFAMGPIGTRLAGDPSMLQNRTINEHLNAVLDPRVAQMASEVFQSEYTPKPLDQGQAPVEEQGGTVQVQSVDEYNNLPSGTRYIDPNGNVRTKR